MDFSYVCQVLCEVLKLLLMGVVNICIYVNLQDFEWVKVLCECYEESWWIFEDDLLLFGGCCIEIEYSCIDVIIEMCLVQVVK